VLQVWQFGTGAQKVAMAKQVLPLLIVASGWITIAAGWGWTRLAFDGKNILQMADYYVGSYNKNGVKLGRTKVKNGRCWIGSGVAVDKKHVFFSDFCGNNGWITRCARFSNYQKCTPMAQKAGYGGVALALHGKNMKYLARSARDARGSPTNMYSNANMKYVVWGTKNAGHLYGHCYLGFGIADMCTMNPDKNLMLFLKDQGNSRNAHMAVYEVKNRACKLKASYTESNVCPGNSQPMGVTYVAGRRRHGKLYLGCRNKQNYVVKRSVQWSGQYTGLLNEKPPTTTTTTTTTTILPLTIKTWTFPEGLSWTIKKKGKTICKGGDYGDWYTSSRIGGCKITNGVYEVTCKDRFKEGWRGASLQIGKHTFCKKYKWGMGAVHKESLRLVR